MQYPKRHCLVTGGAGYIGQHVVLALLREGWRVTIYDNLCTSDPPCLETLWNLAFDTGQSPPFDPGYLAFHRGDIRDNAGVRRCLSNMTVPVTRVIHLAALKSVQESQQVPDLYVEVNLEGLRTILEIAHEAGIREFVFSSSAVVYGGKCPPGGYRIRDSMTQSEWIHSHAYARTKCQGEQLLNAFSLQYPDHTYLALRYFNPIGNHASGKIGERLLQGDSPNIMVQLAKVHMGLKPIFRIMGTDFDTRCISHTRGCEDGTALRDFIDVRDLADAHIKLMEDGRPSGYSCRNVGTGIPISVRCIVDTFGDIAGKPLRVEEVARRPGDLAVSYAAVENTEGTWSPRYDILDSLKSIVTRCDLLGVLNP